MKRRISLILAVMLVSVSTACAAPVDVGDGAAAVPPTNEGSTSSAVAPEADSSIFVPASEDVLADTVANAAPLLHTWTNATVVGASVEISRSDLERSQHLHLDLCEAGVSCAEVVCWLSKEYLVVGAAVCPACEDDLLSCDGQVIRCTTCQEEFDLFTGASNSGDSHAIRMATVPFQLIDGSLRVADADIGDAVAYALAVDGQTASLADGGVEEEPETVEQEDTRDLPACCG
ncbi:hypothetical protein ACFLUT_02610 [Chloroflexota bacterium]